MKTETTKQLNSIQAKKHCFITDKLIYTVKDKSKVEFKETLNSLLNIDILKNKLIDSSSLKLLQVYLKDFNLISSIQDNNKITFSFENEKVRSFISFYFEEITENNYSNFYELINQKADKKQIGILTTEDLEKLKTSLDFVSNDEMKESLTGILIQNNNLISTNSRVMYINKLSSNLETESINNNNLILNAKDLSNFFKGKKTLSESILYYSESQNKIYINDFDVKIIKSNYPNWQSVVDNTYLNKNIKFNKSDIPKKIDKDTNINNVIFDNNGIKKQSAYSENVLNHNFNIEVVNNFEFKFCCQFDHLQLILKHCKDDLIELSYKSKSAPIRVNDNFLFMPIQISEITESSQEQKQDEKQKQDDIQEQILEKEYMEGIPENCEMEIEKENTESKLKNDLTYIKETFYNTIGLNKDRSLSKDFTCKDKGYIDEYHNEITLEIDYNDNNFKLWQVEDNYSIVHIIYPLELKNNITCKVVLNNTDLTKLFIDLKDFCYDLDKTKKLFYSITAMAKDNDLKPKTIYPIVKYSKPIKPAYIDFKQLNFKTYLDISIPKKQIYLLPAPKEKLTVPKFLMEAKFENCESEKSFVALTESQFKNSRTDFDLRFNEILRQKRKIQALKRYKLLNNLIALPIAAIMLFVLITTFFNYQSSNIIFTNLASLDKSDIKEVLIVENNKEVIPDNLMIYEKNNDTSEQSIDFLISSLIVFGISKRKTKKQISNIIKVQKQSFKKLLKTLSVLKLISDPFISFAKIRLKSSIKNLNADKRLINKLF